MGKGGSGGYYAVALGRRTGIFTTWNDAEAQVKGFNGARFKKFPTQLQAEAFLVQRGASSSSASGSAAPVSTTADIVGHKRSRSMESAGAGTATGSSISPPESKRHNSNNDSPFYAVLEGYSTGVYTTWSDVQTQTQGFERPLYRKFDSKAAAEAYLAGYMQAREPPKKPFVTAVDPLQEGANDNGTTTTMAASSPNPNSTGNSTGFWYAVAKGRKTGVFDNWADAKIQIDGLFSAKYKKFASKEEAEAFVRDHQEAATAQPGDPDPKHPDSLVAFCDGSALQNGRFGCQAGYACIFPHNPSWNIAKKLVEDRATNNRAEYLAALEGMNRANQEDTSRTKPLFIFSDSMLLIRSMTEWVAGWQKKNWVKADGNPVLNRDLLELLLKEKGSRRIIWRHVKAHTGKKDWHSKWNDVADHAARNAAAGWEPTSSA